MSVTAGTSFHPFVVPARRDGVTVQQAGCSTKNGSLSDRSADEIFTAFNIN
jgi:hypothetical protein